MRSVYLIVMNADGSLITATSSYIGTDRSLFLALHDAAKRVTDRRIDETAERDPSHTPEQLQRAPWLNRCVPPWLNRSE